MQGSLDLAVAVKKSVNWSSQFVENIITFVFKQGNTSFLFLLVWLDKKIEPMATK